MPRFQLKELKLFLIMVLFSSLASYAQTTVSSLTQLLPYLDDNNANVKLAPGTYTINNSNIDDFNNPILSFEGNNSTYDFTGVTINFDTEIFTAFGNVGVDELSIVGNNNVLKNLKMVDVGSVYDRPSRTALGIRLEGQDNLIEGFDMTVKGSQPYGYGDAFGKGSGYVIKHFKHSAIKVGGDRNHLKNSKILHRAYGHGVFMQGAVDAIIEGVYLEGEVRTTDAMLAGAYGGEGDTGEDKDWMTVWGYRLPAGYMLSLQEDGIRAYTRGNVIINGQTIEERRTTNITVKNCTVKNMRGGYPLALSAGTKYIEGCTSIGCETGFTTGTAKVVDSYSDAAYGPAYKSTYNTTNNFDADITIIPPADGYYNGSNCLAYIGGNNNEVTLRNAEPNMDSDLIIMMAGSFESARFLSTSDPSNQTNHTSTDIELTNYTGVPVVISNGSSDNNISTCGPVTDNGSSNDISQLSNCEGVEPPAACTSFVASSNPSNLEQGIDYAYYEGTWDNLPNFNNLSESASGSTSVIDLSNASSADNFGFTFDGYINIPSEGQYTFYTSSDDGSALWINDDQVVNNDGLHGSQERSGQVCLAAGYHAIHVEYFEKTGGNSLSVSYAGPGISKTTSLNLFREASDNSKEDQTINFPALASKVVGSADFNPGATASSGLAVSYTSSNTSVATIVNNTIRVVGAGSSTITASQSGNTNFNAAASVARELVVTTAPAGCALPWSDADFTISDETVTYSSGAIDISCEDSVEISMAIEGIGSMEDADYLNVFYSVDGGSLQSISENVNAFGDKTISVAGITGNTLQISISGATSVATETYYISNIRVSSSSITNREGNLAITGTASQSTTSAAYGGAASRAIDGNTSGIWNQDSVTHTENEQNPWWQVDLGGVNAIGDINVFNRTDNCCMNRLTNFTVLVLNNNTPTFSQSFSAYPDPSITVNANGAIGNVVRIELNDTNVLSLAEVEVYGTTTTPTTDCAGVVGGTASIDSCGVCSGGTAGIAKDACSDCNNTTAFIEAECYDDMSGVQTESSNGDGENLGHLHEGDWASYNGIDISNVNTFNAQLSTRFSGRSIEIRVGGLNGSVIGSLSVPNTGEWHSYVTASTPITGMNGTHDIYLVFKGGSFNIGSFGFSDEEIEEVTDCSGFYGGLSISQRNPGCSNNDGQITVRFSDNSTQTQLQLSLDGGSSYPVTVNDNSGSYTFSSLRVAEYEVAVRYTDGSCAFNVGHVNLVPDCGEIPLNPGGVSWHDSYEANGFCWCSTNFDHDLDEKEVTINGTRYNVVDICDELEQHPLFRNRNDGDAIYNDVQCGNGPLNDSGDEPICPGRVDNGADDCLVTGVRWDMEWLASRGRFGGTSNKDLFAEEVVYQIYPNPIAQGSKLTIASDSSVVKVQLFDLKGIQLEAELLEDNTIVINQAGGIYLMTTVFANGTFEVTKLIVK